jgi:hypothetical protein
MANNEAIFLLFLSLGTAVGVRYLRANADDG